MGGGCEGMLGSKALRLLLCLSLSAAVVLADKVLFRKSVNHHGVEILGG